LSHGGEIWYWYVAGAMERPVIGLARSSDGSAWRKEAQPVLGPGPYRSWDEYGVADPYIVRVEPYFYLYYLGQDRARAASAWEWRGRGTESVSRSCVRIPFWRSGAAGTLRRGRSRGARGVGVGRLLLDAVYRPRCRAPPAGWVWRESTDGVHFEKLAWVFEGQQAWDRAVVCDPTVLVGKRASSGSGSAAAMLAGRRESERADRLRNIAGGEGALSSAGFTHTTP